MKSTNNIVTPLDLLAGTPPVSTRATITRPTTARTVENNGSVINQKRIGPLKYLDQALRDTPPQLVCTFIDLLRKSITGINSPLVCISIRVGEPSIIPKCKNAGLIVPKLVTIDTRDWVITLNLVCNRNDIATYAPQIDTQRTARTMELAIEEVAGLWCYKGPFQGRTVSLANLDDIVCELVKTFNHHLLDAIALVRTLVLCQQENVLKQTVARLLLNGGVITELMPTITLILAQRRILDGERIAVIDLFRLRIIEVRGQGIASLAPVLWCIQPLRVLETIRGTPEREELRSVYGENILMLSVVTVDTTRKVNLNDLPTQLAGNSVIYCRFTLYNTEEAAATSLSELERYITEHRLREDVSEIALNSPTSSHGGMQTIPI